MRLLHGWFARGTTVIGLVCLSVCVAVPAAVVHAAPPGASAYTAVSPYRILDTRGALGFGRRVNAGESFTLTLTNVPAGASAVVLNLTVDGSADAGFVTVYPTGVPRPLASSINVDGAGQTIANLVTVPVGVGGTVDIFSQMSTDLVADVQGYYMPAALAQAGLFVPMNPTRVLDTRLPTSAHFGALTPGQQIDLDVAGIAGLPVDATAAALNVTVTDSTASGFWTVFPSGTQRPTVSNINVTGAGSTIANQVLAILSGGHTTIFAQSGGNLVIDLVGYFTGASVPPSGIGLFVPVTPSRLLDSRVAPLGARPGHNRTAEVSVATRFGLPASGIGAVVVNATVTDTAAQGFFSVWPAQTDRPTASSLNATHAGQTIANHVITPVSTTGFSFYTQNGAHLVVDIAGWYTGTELPSVLPPSVPLTGPTGPPPNPSFSFSELTTSGSPIRWNPCQAIRYSVNMAGHDPNLRPVITEAVERLEAATGLPFVPVGDSTFMPTKLHITSPAAADGEIVIALGDSSQTDLVPGNVVGQTEIAFNPISGPIVKSSVVVDVGDVGAQPPWSSAGTGPVLLHELGHAVGLGHVTDSAQLMFPSASPTSPTTYAAGDLTGLWQVGASAGCTA
jgi:hypothetical protein